MRYEHTPRPEIENHFHIRELIEAQDKRANDRTYHRDKDKAKQERNLLIKDSKPIEILDFICFKCKEEFKSMSVKEVEIDWTCPTQYIAFYKAKCNKDHWCIRYITDKLNDPFWMNSARLAKDRDTYHKDIIQPHETNYNLLYGKKK